MKIITDAGEKIIQLTNDICNTVTDLKLAALQRQNGNERYAVYQPVKLDLETRKRIPVGRKHILDLQDPIRRSYDIIDPKDITDRHEKVENK